MTSYAPPENDVSSDNKNFTIASTFEKVKSLKFELLFGDCLQKVSKSDNAKDIINAVDYIFSPYQIFGFAYESMGVDFRRFDHVFVLRSCTPGEIGSIIPGISPGAEILARTLTNAASLRFKTILQTLRKSDVKLSKLSASNYRHMNYLLEAKTNIDFFITDLVKNYRE